MYKKILVPHAGTAGGDKALKHAIHIAKFDSSEILLLNVVEQLPTPPTYALSGTDSKKLRLEFKKAAEQAVANSRLEMEKKIAPFKSQNINIRTRIVVGYPDEVITKYIKNEKFDLIIMTKRRKLSGIKKLLTLGSVSRKIVENGTCPVLLLDA